MSASCWRCEKPITEDELYAGKVFDAPQMGLCHRSCEPKHGKAGAGPRTAKGLRIAADARAARIPSRYDCVRLADFDPLHNAAALTVCRRYRDEYYTVCDEVSRDGVIRNGDGDGRSTDIEYRAERLYHARELGDGTSRGLLFTGPVGVGKTFLSCALGLELLPALDVGSYGREPEDGLPLFMLTAAGLVRSVSRSWQKDGGAAGEVIETAQQAEFLILDDLGGEVAAEWALRAVFDLVDHRYNEQRPILATTNLTKPAELTKHYGERITSRLLEMCEVVKMGGPDMRRRRGKDRLTAVPDEPEEAS